MNFDAAKLMAVILPVLTILLNLAVAAIIYIGGLNIRIESAGMTTGSIMAAITYVTQVIQSLMMVTNLFQQISRASASAARVNEILETNPVILDGPYESDSPSDKKQKCMNKSGIAVSFRNVSFHYPGTEDRPVLRNINLDVKRGEILAAIGATGSGKSSLVALIPRFYDASEGIVEIGGRPISSYRLKSLRKKIGYVMQKSELFSDTIANNILWGDALADRNAVREAAEAAQATEFIDGFGDGFETFIAEKGASLSGGQKQRMSLARAFLRKPGILILDEATSSVDTRTEMQIQQAMVNLMKGRTSMIIAHRLSTIRDADKIIVIADGRIVEAGSHEELLAGKGEYFKLYSKQFAGSVT